MPNHSYNTRLSHSFVDIVTGGARTNPMTSTHNHTTEPHGSGNSDSHEDRQVCGIDNTAHPLFLLNNDQPGMILISKKLIGSENYSSWKRSIQIALSAKNKLVIVTGEFPPPSVTSSLYAHWRRVNDMIITWILNTVSDDISNSMNYMHSAYDVWNELNERFSAVSGHKIYEVQKDLFRLEQGNDSVELYFHKLKGFWDELKALESPIVCSCGAAKSWDAQNEKTKLAQFLMGLHNSYKTARGQLLMMNPWPSLNHAYMLIKQEEKQRQMQPSIENSLALMANLPKALPKLTNKPLTTTLECSYCHGKNHLREKCFKLVGYPTDHPYHPNNKGKKKQFTRFSQQNSNVSAANNKNTQAMQVSTEIESNSSHFNN